MKYTNAQIFNIALGAKNFYDDKQAQFPVKAGFYLFKNLKLFTQAAEDINKIRAQILLKYEKLEDEQEKLEKTQKDLLELSKITQKIDIYPIALEDFEDMRLSHEQIQILIEMLPDKKKKKTMEDYEIDDDDDDEIIEEINL